MTCGGSPGEGEVSYQGPLTFMLIFQVGQSGRRLWGFDAKLHSIKQIPLKCRGPFGHEA